MPQDCKIERLLDWERVEYWKVRLGFDHVVVVIVVLLFLLQIFDNFAVGDVVRMACDIKESFECTESLGVRKKHGFWE